MQKEETYTCELCGENIKPDQLAEMHNYDRPKHTWGNKRLPLITSGIVHDQCGLSAGWEPS